MEFNAWNDFHSFEQQWNLFLKNYEYFYFYKISFESTKVELEKIFNSTIYHIILNLTRSKELLWFYCINTVNFKSPGTSIDDLLNFTFGLFYATNENVSYRLYYKDEFRNRRELCIKKVSWI